MKKHEFNDTFLNKEKDILNDIADEDVIYDESQTGPQEEPFLFEYHLDLELWKKFLEKQNKKHY